MEYLPILAFAAVAAWLLYRVIRHGGVKGAVFGSRILETHGEIEPSRRGLTATAVKVHSIESDSVEPDVGLELVSRGGGKYHMTPVRLSRAEARRLAQLLQQATGQGA